MKKLLFFILSVFIYTSSFSQNISTGLDPSSTASEVIGGNDGSWRYGTAINGTSIPIVIGPYGSFWQGAPITGTGAQWIGNNKSNSSQKPGIYYFEKSINIPSGVQFLTYNFSLTGDDIIQSVELINPSGGIEKDLTTEYSITKAYFLSKLIKGKVETCEKKGIWKLRIKVNFIDNIGGLLVSGNVGLEGQCSDCIIPDEKCNPDFKIKLTMNERCGITIDAAPVVTKGAQHYWGIVENKGDCKPIPLGQIISGNTFGLSVSPTGVVTPIGMGTGLSGGTTGYGYFYAGLWGPTSGKCYKITHYIKCCQKWYRKTVCFCPTLCNNEKETEFEVVSGNEIPKDLK